MPQRRSAPVLRLGLLVLLGLACSRSDAPTQLAYCGELDLVSGLVLGKDSSQGAVTTRLGAVTVTRDTSIDQIVSDTLTWVSTYLHVGSTPLVILSAARRNSEVPSVGPRISDGYNIVVRAAGDCGTAKLLEVELFKVAPSAYRQTEWALFVLDLTGSKPRLVSYPLAGSIYVEPRTVYRIRSVSPWTVERVVRGASADIVDGPFEYVPNAGSFVDVKVPTWARDIIVRGDVSAFADSKQIANKLTTVFKPLVPAVLDSARQTLRATLRSNQQRHWRILDGRYVLVSVDEWYQGNHPVLGSTHDVVLDLVADAGWYLTMEWGGHDWVQPFPESAELHGSNAVIEVSTFEGMLNQSDAVQGFDIAYLDSTMFSWNREGDHYNGMGQITLNRLPWRCKKLEDKEFSVGKCEAFTRAAPSLSSAQLPQAMPSTPTAVDFVTEGVRAMSHICQLQVLGTIVSDGRLDDRISPSDLRRHTQCVIRLARSVTPARKVMSLTPYCDAVWQWGASQRWDNKEWVIVTNGTGCPLPQ